MKVLLIIAILIALGSLIYTVAFPKTGEKFTEFYILGPDGKADSYPRELAVGEQGSVIIGIVNREHVDNLSYYVEIRIDGELIDITSPITLDHNKKWEQPLDFCPLKAKPNQKVEFTLYKANKPYEECHLWLNVS